MGVPCLDILHWNVFEIYFLGVERGKLNIQQVGVDGFHCEPVSFSSSFSSGTPVRVFASINHGNESSKVHDSAFFGWRMWQQIVSRPVSCKVVGASNITPPLIGLHSKVPSQGFIMEKLHLAYLQQEQSAIRLHFSRYDSSKSLSVAPIIW